MNIFVGSLIVVAVVVVSGFVLVRDPQNFDVKEVQATTRSIRIPHAEKVAMVRKEQVPQADLSPSQRRAAFALFLGLWHGGR